MRPNHAGFAVRATPRQDPKDEMQAMTPDPSLPLTRDVVLIGGGHTHALVLRRWGMAPVPGARLTLIEPGATAAYSGMLPGHVAGHYDRAALDIDLVDLARFAGARLVRGAATGLDPEAREVQVPGRPPVRYDIASIDIGITSDMPALPGFSDNAVPAKPLGPFAARWSDFTARVTRGQAAPRVAVIGAGVAGVELALAMAHRLRTLGADPAVTLVERGRALAALGSRARSVLERRLIAAGITVMEHREIVRVDRDALRLADGEAVPFAFCVGTAGTRAHRWLAETGLATTDGFIDVDATLRSTSHRSVYAAGDCAHLTHAPRPKAGVYAVRQAPVLAWNLRADLTGRQRRHYRPQRDYLKLISLGGKEALVERAPVVLAAPFLWTLKDRIDRDFMAKFDRLPAMPLPRVPEGAARGVRAAVGTAPPCAGCAAKVGPGALAGGLSAQATPRRADVTRLDGDDAALIGTGAARQVVTSDHLRALVADPWLMGRIAAVHALGDVWAMGAAPQAALASLILPRMTPAMQAATLAEITHGAGGVLAAAGADLAGGHTSTGAEMTIGFTVTGTLDGAPLTLSGAQAGDALILTKPIGSGVLMAAHMRGRARGADIAALLDQMTLGQGDAAAHLAPAAHAMTDVTGFGLAGHLLGMLRASGVGAEIDLAALPLHPGVEEAAGRGIGSTLLPETRAHAAPHVTAPNGARTALLYDPQTCGGLLAAVPEGRADALVAAIRQDGLGAAARIGRIVEGAPRITCC